MAVRRLASLLNKEVDMIAEKVASLADHRRRLAASRFEAAIMKFLVMGGTKERAHEIIEAAASAESPEALDAAIRQLEEGDAT